MEEPPHRQLEDPAYLGRPFPRTRSSYVSRRMPGCTGLVLLAAVCAGVIPAAVRHGELVTVAAAALVFAGCVAGAVWLLRRAVAEERDARWEDRQYR